MNTWTSESRLACGSTIPYSICPPASVWTFVTVPITSPAGNAPPEPDVVISSPAKICAPSARKVSFACFCFIREYSPTTIPELPVETIVPPTLISTSINVLTVAHVSPSSVTWPTSAPYSVITGSPYSMPLRALADGKGRRPVGCRPKNHLAGFQNIVRMFVTKIQQFPQTNIFL